jgi:hypothetical protein
MSLLYNSESRRTHGCLVCEGTTLPYPGKGPGSGNSTTMDPSTAFKLPCVCTCEHLADRNSAHNRSVGEGAAQHCGLFRICVSLLTLLRAKPAACPWAAPAVFCCRTRFTWEAGSQWIGDSPSSSDIRMAAFLRLLCFEHTPSLVKPREYHVSQPMFCFREGRLAFPVKHVHEGSRCLQPMDRAEGLGDVGYRVYLFKCPLRGSD